MLTHVSLVNNDENQITSPASKPDIDSVSTPWRMVEARVHVALPPHLLNDATHAATSIAYSNLLLRHNASLGGVVASISSPLKLCQPPHCIGASPFVHVRASASILLFSPLPGCVLTGTVNYVAPDHVGMNVFSTFQAVLPIKQASSNYQYTGKDNKSWIYINYNDGKTTRNKSEDIDDENARDKSKDIIIGCSIKFRVTRVIPTPSGLFQMIVSIKNNVTNNDENNNLKDEKLGVVIGTESISNYQSSNRYDNMNIDAQWDNPDENNLDESEDVLFRMQEKANERRRASSSIGGVHSNHENSLLSRSAFGSAFQRRNPTGGSTTPQPNANIMTDDAQVVGVDSLNDQTTTKHNDDTDSAIVSSHGLNGNGLNNREDESTLTTESSKKDKTKKKKKKKKKKKAELDADEDDKENTNSTLHHQEEKEKHAFVNEHKDENEEKEEASVNKILKDDDSAPINLSQTSNGTIDTTSKDLSQSSKKKKKSKRASSNLTQSPSKKKSKKNEEIREQVTSVGQVLSQIPEDKDAEEVLVPESQPIEIDGRLVATQASQIHPEFPLYDSQNIVLGTQSPSQSQSQIQSQSKKLKKRKRSPEKVEGKLTEEESLTTSVSEGSGRKDAKKKKRKKEKQNRVSAVEFNQRRSFASG